MNIIGISGIQSSMPFKRRQWPGLDEREYRMSQGHDAAAALVVDGRLVAAAAEERFDLKKHSAHFPIGAIRYCLADAGLSIDDVDEIAHGFDYTRYAKVFSPDEVGAQRYREVFSREALLNRVQESLPGFPAAKVFHVPHHVAHAASAYFTSGWDDCLVVVIDGMGEAHSASIYRGQEGRLDPVHQISAHDSIGILYSLVTLHLGFDFNSDEYKIMGLAPYGDPERFRPFFDDAVQLLENGSVRIPILRLNTTPDDRENYVATRRHLGEHLIRERRPDEEITQAHRDVAASLQACLDRTMLHIAGSFARQTGLRKLAMAGGVALNCTANGRLMQSGLFDDMYVQPASGDDGSALGAALYRASLQRKIENRRMSVPFCGPGCSREDVETVIDEFSDRIEVTRFASLDAACRCAAGMIAEGKVLAWHRGRMEFGPRALGNRSILADPGNPEMRDRINGMVKKREAFRPFAPAVTVEQVHQWFDVPPNTELPYMIMIVDVRPEHRAGLPAITHVNGSARAQTVAKRDNPDFYALLKQVGKLTGREMVLNTSFNVKGQPMVNTPREAVETFLGTGIDALFLEHALITRRRSAL
jgi:carbamoyltransferase